MSGTLVSAESLWFSAPASLSLIEARQEAVVCYKV